MKNHLFRYSIQKFKDVTSTNTLLLEASRRNKPEGLVYVTDHQTQGRGKPGRKWVSPPKKDLLFSVLLRPPIHANRAPILTQIACRSVAKVLKDACKISSTIKRPNDILVNGKKICGVLTETSSTASGKLDGVVIGVGLNINSELSDLPRGSTSLKSILGRTVGRQNLFRKILSQLKDDVHELYHSPA